MNESILRNSYFEVKQKFGNCNNVLLTSLNNDHVFFPFLELTPSGKRQKHTSKKLQFYVTSFKNQMQITCFGNTPKSHALLRAEYFEIYGVACGVLTDVTTEITSVWFSQM
jgi:hypothetical protein